MAAPSGLGLSTVGVRYLPISLWDLFALNLIVPLPRGLVHPMFVPLISTCSFRKSHAFMQKSCKRHLSEPAVHPHPLHRRLYVASPPARVDTPSLKLTTPSPGLTESLWRGTLCLICVAREDFAGDGFLLPTLPQRTLQWQAHVEQIWTTYFAVTRRITCMLLVPWDLGHWNNRRPQWHRHG